MPTIRVPPSADPVAYYRQVGPTMLAHLVGRQLIGSATGRHLSVDQPSGDSPPSSESPTRLHIETLADLDAAVLDGIVGFRALLQAEPGLLAIAVRAGAGAQIDTVATATLLLAESMATDGLVTFPMTDGAGGLQLIAFRPGAVPGDDRSSDAAGYVRMLTRRAPEVATTDEADAGGRALVCPLSGRSGAAVAVPYSLVPGESCGGNDGGTLSEPLSLGVVAPLTLDDVAAATAGMPLEIGPPDVADRISMFGDLAAALGRSTGPAA